MDYKRIKEIKSQSINLISRMQMLEELHKETMEKIDDVQKVCNHEFIFINQKYTNKVYNYLKCGKCLVCDKRITMTPNNFALEEKIFISTDKIIDVSGEFDEWAIDCDCSETKSEIEEAQRVFNRLMNESEYEKDTIKSAIDESVKEYNEDALPGLGIFFMLVWENSNNEEKNTILEKIKSNLK